MENSIGKLIFTAYKDEESNIRLAIAPQFTAFTNGKEYFIDLGDNLMKMTIEVARKLETPIPEGVKESND